MTNPKDNEIFRQSFRKQALSGVEAAAVLGRLAGTADVVKISRMLSNPDPVIREGTIKSLMQLGGRQAIKAIASCVYDKDQRVRMTACQALGRLRAHEARAELYDALQDKDPSVACTAAGALGAMGDKIGLPQVIKYIKISGRHQWQALRALNMIMGQDFRINEHGLSDALRWLRARRRLLKLKKHL